MNGQNRASVPDTASWHIFKTGNIYLSKKYFPELKHLAECLIQLLLWLASIWNAFTFIAEIINQHNFREIWAWRSFDYAVNCPHECGPAFIMEDNDDTGGEQVFVIMPVLAPAKDNCVIFQCALSIWDKHGGSHFSEPTGSSSIQS